MDPLVPDRGVVSDAGGLIDSRPPEAATASDGEVFDSARGDSAVAADSIVSVCGAAAPCAEHTECNQGEICEAQGSNTTCCVPYPREVTLCLTGAIKQDEQNGNMVFEDLCTEYGTGVIQDCDTGSCFNSWDNYSLLFQGQDYSAAYAALFAALDENDDGIFDDADQGGIINLVGYSWGGLNVVYLATEFLSDPRVAASRARVHRVIAIDPFQRTLAPPPAVTKVPQGVDRFWEYRHSISPAGDCSAGAPFGPYKGVPPTCPAGSECHDFDYSTAPGKSFPAGWGKWGHSSYTGDQIGHCSVVDVAYDAVLSNLRNHVYLAVPAEQPVPVY